MSHDVTENLPGAPHAHPAFRTHTPTDTRHRCSVEATRAIEGSQGGNGKIPNPPCRETSPHLRLPNQSARSEAPAKRRLSAHAREVNAGDHVVVRVLVVALLQEDEARLVCLPREGGGRTRWRP